MKKKDYPKKSWISYNNPCIKCGSSDAVAIDSIGAAYCFSCNTHFRTYDEMPLETKPNKQVVYKDIISVEDILNLPIVELADRGISQAAAEYYGVRTSFNTETGEPEYRYFPYYQGDHLCFKRKKIGDKGNQSFIGNIKGESFNLFGKEKVVGTNFLIITEGECFVGDAEVLTPTGWVKLSEYNGEKVLQVNQDQTSSFVDTLGYIKKEYSDDLIEYNSSSWYSLTTKNHNLVRLDKNNNLIKQEAVNNTLTNYKIPRVVYGINNHGAEFTDMELRAMVMFSADWSYTNQGGPRASIKKDRKKKRIEWILDSLGLKYSIKDGPREGYRYYRIYKDQPFEKYWAKEFNHELIGKLSNDQIKIILEEILYWDGNSVPNRSQIEYSTNIYNNALFIQTLAHLVGYTSTIMDRANNYGSWYKVSILFNKQTSSTQKGFNFIKHDGPVYCVTVPSGMLLVRQNKSISVSGNCDALAAYDLLAKSKKQYNVVSLPSGANIRGIQDNLKWLYDFTCVTLAFDNDEPGKKCAEKTSKLFDPGQCKVARFKDYKDSNDYLVAGKYKDWLSCIYNATVMKPDGIVTISDIWEEATRKPEWGLPWPWEKLTNVTYGRRRGEIYGIGAGTGVN